MSASEAAHRPESRGRSREAVARRSSLLIAAGVGLAWVGALAARRDDRDRRPDPHRQSRRGPFIQAVDGVLIEYEGRLADGTVFDNSARHGGPQPMIAGQVIPGFAEALTKMQKGGKLQDPYPGQLAYGANPPPGSPIGPNADLDFDVTSSRSCRMPR